MLRLAFGILKRVQGRFGSTLQIVADLAESLGVPSGITSLVNRGDTRSGVAFTPSGYGSSLSQTPSISAGNDTIARVSSPDAPPPVAAAVASNAPASEAAATRSGTNGSRSNNGSGSTTRTSRKRAVVGDRNKSSRVRTLQVDDEINGSTYLARIIWALGVAQLEGLGSLRPADMARMIMSRSPVSLEPPNVARYIRRSQPTCIAVERAEGGSSFYKLNTQGKKLFETNFCSAN